MFIFFLLIVSLLAIHGLSSEAFEGYESAPGVFSSIDNTTADHLSNSGTETTIFTTISSTATVVRTMTLFSYSPLATCLSETSFPLPHSLSNTTTTSTGLDYPNITTSTLAVPSHNFTSYGPVSMTASSVFTISTNSIIPPTTTSSGNDSIGSSMTTTINTTIPTHTTPSIIPPISPFSNEAHITYSPLMFLVTSVVLCFYVIIL